MHQHPTGRLSIGWLVIYIAWAVLLLRRRPAAPIAQALATSLLSGVWVGLVQTALWSTYASNHPEIAITVATLSPAMRALRLFGTALGFSLVLGIILGYAVRWRLGRQTLAYSSGHP